VFGIQLAYAVKFEIRSAKIETILMPELLRDFEIRTLGRWFDAPKSSTWTAEHVRTTGTVYISLWIFDIPYSAVQNTRAWLFV